MTEQRPGWLEYSMRLAIATAERSTCRVKVGAVATRDNRIVAHGYNGSLPGRPHCTDPGVGCDMVDDHCVRTVHAEANLIAHAAEIGIALKGCALFVTHLTCFPCLKLVLSAGFVRIYYAEAYRPEDRIFDLARAMSVPIERAA